MEAELWQRIMMSCAALVLLGSGLGMLGTGGILLRRRD